MRVCKRRVKGYALSIFRPDRLERGVERFPCGCWIFRGFFFAISKQAASCEEVW